MLRLRTQKTDPSIVDQIDQLWKTHWTADVVEAMEGCVSRRTVYRILVRLREKDAQQVQEDAKAIVETRKQEIRERLAANPRVDKYKHTAQFPANLRRVRSN